jgi:hypothetical protein
LPRACWVAVTLVSLLAPPVAAQQRLAWERTLEFLDD